MQLSRDAGGRVGCPCFSDLVVITVIVSSKDNNNIDEWFCCLFDLSSRFTQYQRMLSNLAQCEFSMGKTLMVYDMNLREMENYETIYNNIGRTLLCGYCAFVCKYSFLWVCCCCFFLLFKGPHLKNMKKLHMLSVGNVIYFTLQNKTSPLHMRRSQNAKKKYRGQREYGKIAKVRTWYLAIFE